MIWGQQKTALTHDAAPFLTPYTPQTRVAHSCYSQSATNTSTTTIIIIIIIIDDTSLETKIQGCVSQQLATKIYTEVSLILLNEKCNNYNYIYKSIKLTRQAAWNVSEESVKLRIQRRCSSASFLVTLTVHCGSQSVYAASLQTAPLSASNTWSTTPDVQSLNLWRLWVVDQSTCLHKPTIIIIIIPVQKYGVQYNALNLAINFKQ